MEASNAHSNDRRAPGLKAEGKKLNCRKRFPVASQRHGFQKGVPGKGVSGMKKAWSIPSSHDRRYMARIVAGVSPGSP